MACANPQQDIPSYRLEITQSFPPETAAIDDNYLAQPVSFTKIGQTLYVADVKRHEILMYGLDEQYLGIFGRTGDGPGEFRDLNHLLPDINDDGLWVLSHGGMRLQHVDIECKYLDGFYVPFPTGSFAPLTEETIVFTCAPNSEHGSLVCTDHKGDIKWISSDILEVEGTAGFIPLTNSSSVVVLKGEVWQLFEHFNVIRVFSSEGELLRETSFDDELIKTAHEDNIADHLLLATGVARINDRQVAPSRIFNKPRTVNGDIWVQAYLHLFPIKEPDRRHYILQINDQGMIVARFYTETEEPLFLVDILPLNMESTFNVMLLTAGYRELIPQIHYCLVAINN